MTPKPFALAAAITLFAAFQTPTQAGAADLLNAAVAPTGGAVDQYNSHGNMDGGGCQGGR